MGRKCPKGHGLFDAGIMGATRERSFIASFFNAILACAVILAAAASAGALLSKSNTAWVAVALIAFTIAGILSLLRGRRWKKQGGAVARLVPRANGMALACLLAGAGLFVIGTAVELIRH